MGRLIPGTGNLSKRFGGLQALDRFIAPRRFIALRAGGAGEGRDG